MHITYEYAKNLAFSSFMSLDFLTFNVTLFNRIEYVQVDIKIYKQRVGTSY